jgi:very-short-patch-repair endonuclease
MATAKSTKTSPSDIEATEFYQQHLAQSRQWLIDAAAAEHEYLARVLLRDAESPLEAAFMAWWQARRVFGAFTELDLYMQREVNAGGDRYRLDFVVEPFIDGYFAGVSALVAIELDGHGFHERTKEQVAYRNRRDRALQAAGWLVLHYSGSEFHRDPEAVIEDAYGRAFIAFSRQKDGR